MSEHSSKMHVASHRRFLCQMRRYRNWNAKNVRFNFSVHCVIFSMNLNDNLAMKQNKYMNIKNLRVQLWFTSQNMIEWGYATNFWYYHGASYVVSSKIQNWKITTMLFYYLSSFLDSDISKVEIILEQREVAFLSPSKICENLNFSREIQIFANFAGW